jgi:hypothetical protein
MVASRSSGVTVMPTRSWENVKVMSVSIVDRISFAIPGTGSGAPQLLRIARAGQAAEIGVPVMNWEHCAGTAVAPQVTCGARRGWKPNGRQPHNQMSRRARSDVEQQPTSRTLSLGLTLDICGAIYGRILAIDCRGGQDAR